MFTEMCRFQQHSAVIKFFKKRLYLSADTHNQLHPTACN